MVSFGAGLGRGTILFSLALGFTTALHAQAPTGEIRLEIRDPSLAPMQASGRLRSLGPGVDRRFLTSPEGGYVIQGLSLGRYRLEVSKNGFATQSMLIDVQSSAPIIRTVTLALSTQASRVEVVAATPLPGTDMPLDEIPAPVQTASAHDLEQSGALDLSDLLNQRLSGIDVNQNQGNPYQPDINYRGYTASPLMGTPEGISVYMDGVRQNQPFGDIVAWDLIPKIAISEVALMPGSNPLFGLNTLGGAVSVETKDGNSAPGTSMAQTGSTTSSRGPSNSSMGAPMPKDSTGMSPATCSARTAGANILPRRSASPSANWDGRMGIPLLVLASLTPIIGLQGMGFRISDFSSTTTEACTVFPISPGTGRRLSISPCATTSTRT